MKVAVQGYHAGKAWPGCAFVLEWNLPFQNPGSATALRHIQAIMCVYVHIRLILHVLMITLLMYVHTSNNLYIF